MKNHNSTIFCRLKKISSRYSRPYFTVLLTILLISFCLDGYAVKSFQNEKLNYVISYKWGLIHKETGEATLTLKNNGNYYNVSLTAKTRPWADRLYQVRDTLKGTINATNLKPISYEKLTHEKGEYKRDAIKFSYSGNVTRGTAIRERYKKGKPSVTEKTFSASGDVFDMLSVFYYLRSLDYGSFTKGKTLQATIFSGKQKETIRIKYLGKEKVKLKNKNERESYHIEFNFTSSGGKKSSDDMNVWISTDSKHIPLYLTAKLPIGEVRAYYME